MGFTKDFNVAIIGGGMCGLVCAIVLMRAGIDVQIFESAHQFGEVGAAVGIGANAIEALKAMGLYDDLLNKTDEMIPQMRAMVLVSGRGSHETILDYAEVSPVVDSAGVYRPTFIDALSELIDPSITHFKKRCVSVVPNKNGSNTISFEDGTTYDADLVLGCDGVKSATRAAVLGDNIKNPVSFANTTAYRGIVSWDELKAAGVKTDLTARSYSFIGDKSHVIVFSIKENKFINIVAFFGDTTAPIGSIVIPQSEWVTFVSAESVSEQYQGWGPDVEIMLKHLNNPHKWAIHCLNPPMESFVRGRVALVGDAAHAMPPHLGAGFGQGCEDAHLLCRLLTDSRACKNDLEKILLAYDGIRVPRANKILEGSIQAGRYYDSYKPDISEEEVETLKKGVTGQWDHVWFHDLEKDIEAATSKVWAAK